MGQYVLKLLNLTTKKYYLIVVYRVKNIFTL